MSTRFDTILSLYDKLNPNSPRYYEHWMQSPPNPFFSDKEYLEEEILEILEIPVFLRDQIINLVEWLATKAREKLPWPFGKIFGLLMDIALSLIHFVLLAALIVLTMVAWIVYPIFTFTLGIIHLVTCVFPEVLLRTLFLNRPTFGNAEDLRFLPNPHSDSPPLGFREAPVDYLGFKFRQACYTILLIPFAIVNTALTFILFPVESIKSVWRFITESAQEREERKQHDLAMTIAECSEGNRSKDDSEFAFQAYQRLNKDIRSEYLHHAMDMKIPPENLATLTHGFDDDQYLNVLHNITPKKFDSEPVISQNQRKIDFASAGIPVEARTKFIQEEELPICHVRNALPLFEQMSDTQKMESLKDGPLLFKILSQARDQALLNEVKRLAAIQNGSLSDTIFSSLPLIKTLALCGQTLPGVKPIDLKKMIMGQEKIIYEESSAEPLSILILQGRVDPEIIFKNPQERKDFFARADKPLARMVLDVLKNRSKHYLTHYYSLLRPWLDGCSAEEIQNYLDLKNQDGQNLLTYAVPFGRYEDLDAWVINRTEQPVVASDRGVANGQGIHDESVHKTVKDSLVAVSGFLASNPLDYERELSELTAFVNHQRAPSLKQSQDMRSLKRASAVVKRGFKRLLGNLSFSESGTSIEQILTLFWVRLKKMNNKKEVWDIFCTQLEAIQRGYNSDGDAGIVDHPICWGGTINQLTMVLQSVAPDLVWVDLMNEKFFMLKAMVLIRDRFLEEAILKIDRSRYQEFLRSRGPTGAFFSRELLETFKNDPQFKKTLRELCVHPSLGRQSVEYLDSFIEKFFDNLAILQTNNWTDLDFMTSSLGTMLDQINGVFTAHLGATTDAPLTFKYRAQQVVQAPDESEDELEYDLIALEKLASKFTPNDTQRFPQAFKNLTHNHSLMNNIGNLLRGEITRKVYLLDTLNENSDAKAWLENPSLFNKTLTALGITWEYNEDDLEEFLHENSVAIYTALFNIYNENLREAEVIKNATCWVAM